jgi:hypothetical protein
MIFYSDTGPKTEFDSRLMSQINPNSQYVKHLKNMFYLKFLELKSPDFIERCQAKKEIEICNKKLTFWGRRITNQKFVDDMHYELKQTWGHDFYS